MLFEFILQYRLKRNFLQQNFDDFKMLSREIYAVDRHCVKKILDRRVIRLQHLFEVIPDKGSDEPSHHRGDDRHEQVLLCFIVAKDRPFGYSCHLGDFAGGGGCVSLLGKNLHCSLNNFNLLLCQFAFIYFSDFLNPLF
ncbi:hypothetical protein D3C77_414960 [compost metagenome]